MERVTGTLTIEDAHILFRNFAGREERYNPAGKRNFCVLIGEEDAKALEADGWNIKYLKSRDGEDPEVRPYLHVTVSFDRIKPKVTMINGKSKVLLDETTISILDYADIENVDLIIRPYNWEVNSKSGVKAYLKSMWVTITEDPFERKYMELEDDENLPL